MVCTYEAQTVGSAGWDSEVLYWVRTSCVAVQKAPLQTRVSEHGGFAGGPGTSNNTCDAVPRFGLIRTVPMCTWFRLRPSCRAWLCCADNSIQACSNAVFACAGPVRYVQTATGWAGVQYYRRFLRQTALTRSALSKVSRHTRTHSIESPQKVVFPSVGHVWQLHS